MSGRIERIPFDADLLALHALNPARYPALFESVADDTRLGRFDILFAFPDGCLRSDADDGEFLPALDAAWRDLRQPVDTERSLPFTGGWFVLLGYELAREIEPRLELRTEPRQPVAVALRIPVAVVRDRADGTAWVVAERGHESAIDTLRADLAQGGAGLPTAPESLVTDLAPEEPERFLRAVEAAQRRIAAGDVYQVNLSREWTARLRDGVRPVDVYASLRRTNPAPFAGIVSVPGVTVISSSPERLFRTDGRMVETRPIAGTRPRDGDSDDDARRAELHGHPKERAEHVMLIDLERNDLGRVCRAGTVEVDEFMVVETYEHVHHIVSNVRGELREDATPGTIIRSVFPGGSITGCPKVRCMEIISELERRPRGVYTGAMGYLNRDGSADLNILIRSIVVMGSDVSVAAGCGIVADSDPVRELEETRAKARGLLLAFGESGAG